MIKEWETHELRYLRKQSHRPSLVSNAHSLSFACSSNYCLTTALWKFSSGLFYGLWRCVPGSVMLSPSKQFQIFAINSFSQKKISQIWLQLQLGTFIHSSRHHNLIFHMRNLDLENLMYHQVHVAGRKQNLLIDPNPSPADFRIHSH